MGTNYYWALDGGHIGKRYAAGGGKMGFIWAADAYVQCKIDQLQDPHITSIHDFYLQMPLWDARAWNFLADILLVEDEYHARYSLREFLDTIVAPCAIHEQSEYDDFS